MIIEILIFIVLLFILVVLHEFGHFLAAKKSKIKVLEFGIGFPPRLWGVQLGETLLSVNLLPLGGFVRMFGEDETDKELLKNPRSFGFQAVWKRIIVVVAGVIMNLLLAWLLFYIVIAWQGFQVVLPSPQPIVSIVEVEKGSPAQIAGLKVGDRVMAVDNQFVTDIGQLQNIIKADAGKTTTLAIADWQGNNIHKVTLIPRKNPPPGQGEMGVALAPETIQQYATLPEKIFSAPVYSWELTQLTIQGLAQTIGFVGHGQFTKASQNVAGPVGIVRLSNSILGNGFSIDTVMSYLNFAALLSLTLAIMNILPFPALDGGHLLFLLIEAIGRKRVNPEIEKYIHLAGFAILMGLVILITYSDIHKIVH